MKYFERKTSQCLFPLKFLNVLEIEHTRVLLLFLHYLKIKFCSTVVMANRVTEN